MTTPVTAEPAALQRLAERLMAEVATNDEMYASLHGSDLRLDGWLFGLTPEEQALFAQPSASTSPASEQRAAKSAYPKETQ